MGTSISREEDRERKERAVEGLRAVRLSTDLPGHLVPNMPDDRPRFSSGAARSSSQTNTEQRIRRLGERGWLPPEI